MSGLLEACDILDAWNGEGDPTPEVEEAVRVCFALPSDTELHWEPEVGWQYRELRGVKDINISFTVDI